ncbi:hypothetical protein, partial [Thiolapillus sp.]
MRTTGKQCGLAATGVYQPSLRSPWLAADDYVHGLKNAVRMATLKWGSGHRIELSRWNPRKHVPPLVI